MSSVTSIRSRGAWGDFGEVALWLLKGFLIILWIMGAFCGSFVAVYNHLQRIAAPPLGETPRISYPLPYVPASAVVYEEYTVRIYDKPGLLTGGAAALAGGVGKPYTLKQFIADTGGQATFLTVAKGLPTLDSDGSEYRYAVNLTYTARGLDGAQTYFVANLGLIPKGTLYGDYLMTGNERMYPELVDSALSIPFTYKKNLLAIVFWSLVAAVMGGIFAFAFYDYITRPLGSFARRRIIWYIHQRAVAKALGK